MRDITTLAAQIASLRQFFAVVGFTMPPAYRAVLGHRERMPPAGIFSDIFVDPVEVIALNQKLRKEGWMNSPGWPDQFLALGEDPGANVLFFDATQKGDPVWLADIDITTMDRDVTMCREVVKQAPSFAEFAANTWQRYLEQEGELPWELHGDDRLFELLRKSPSAEILEHYFLPSAVLYEAYEAWNLRMGDYTLFFSIINLAEESARTLVLPCMKLAIRQPTAGRFRAAINLLQRLLEKAGWTKLPPENASLAKGICVRVAELSLEKFEPWQSLKPILEGT